MAPRRGPGGVPEGSRRGPRAKLGRSPFLEPFGDPSGAPLGALLGPSWGPLGSHLGLPDLPGGPLGGISPHREPPRSSPGRLRSEFGSGKGKSLKSYENTMFFQHFCPPRPSEEAQERASWALLGHQGAQEPRRAHQEEPQEATKRRPRGAKPQRSPETAQKEPKGAQNRNLAWQRNGKRDYITIFILLPVRACVPILFAGEKPDR